MMIDETSSFKIVKFPLFITWGLYQHEKHTASYIASYNMYFLIELQFNYINVKRCT